MLTEEMKERLTLLLDSGQIENGTYDLVKRELHRLIEHDFIDLEHEQAGSFTNHLAIAAERINQGEALESTTSEIEDVIHANPVLFKKSESVLEHCLWKEGAVSTRAENGFITLYLGMFTQQ
ncbi:hypothetical protein [Salibacterium aidingense]|uniref:hypothetical protein n=1 Tax=Salibacterium aidingense TaxID=384933 RepID=UPI000402B957|nr:hypothetical protein [Salibacterium aidingense]